MNGPKKVKCELYRDSFQNWKSYPIHKAQLIIADIPYNLGNQAYGSNPMWYVDGDNKNGESDKAKKSFFYSDGYLERIHQIDTEINDLKAEIESYAGLLSMYEILAKAFSQDGVPHQIIRNIIPHIENTANSILASMTGGSMGVQFVLDKITKGKDGEKATLDVMIEEYGKTTLPYASKSGGEKVKASLAVILALSEIKSSSAGIQMGMLFIDEPPFLDEDGTQAYVDALEAIRKRYKDTKIMAITHDAAMKARFDQSITIVKDEGGSRVVYD